MNQSDMYLLDIRDLECAYGSVKVLTGITLQLAPGKVLGVIGENGAGKSTLVKAILGLIKPAAGTVALHGKAAAIHQEFNLVRDLTAAENIFLGREKRNRFGFLNRSLMRELAEKEFARMGVDVDPDAKVAELTISERQMTEIAKATAVHAKILIMDEPSTLLNREETEKLFAIIREYKAQGNSVIYISHKLDEVQEICDEIAILRDGVLVDILPSAETNPLEMAGKMVGRELTKLFPDKLPEPSGEPVLQVEHLSSGIMVRDVSFTIAPGEILGVAGLAGSGRSELADTIFAIRRKDSGKIILNGKELHLHSPHEALKHGIGYLTEDRQESGILTDFDISENISLASLSRYAPSGWIHRAPISQTAQQYVREFKIKCTGIDSPLKNLSGGNQQKVALAKGLDTRPKVFIFDEPTRGVDVSARRDIYDFIHDLAASGMACLMICSDLEELLGMCRRVMVMRSGSIAGFAEGEALSEKNLIYLATGVKQ